MSFAILTVAFYSITAYGDKYISVKLKCGPGEYTFLVSFTTVLWLLLCLPVTGWHLQFQGDSIFLLVFLVMWKVLEFYTTAILLKSMEPYELKAWLGINVVLSYGVNLWNGKSGFQIYIFAFAIALIAGIYLILTSRTGEKRVKKEILIAVIYILSKFLYGIHMGRMSKYGNSTTVLIVVLLVVAVLQLPRLERKNLLKKEGLAAVGLSRLTNAAGLLTEAEAAVSNIYFYTLIQPLQLFVLFVVCLLTKSPMNSKKRIGSVLCVAAVFLMTIAFGSGK